MNNIEILKDLEKTLLDFKANYVGASEPLSAEKLFKIQKPTPSINDKEPIPLGKVGTGVRVVYGNPTDHRGSSVVDTVIIGYFEDINREGVMLELIPVPDGLSVYERLGIFGHRHLLTRIRHDNLSGIECVLGKGSYDTYKSVASHIEVKFDELRDIEAIKEALIA